MTLPRTDLEFFLEVSHQLADLIIKRGYLLRGGSTRSLLLAGMSWPNSWLQAKIIPSSGGIEDQSWDTAHEMAKIFKRELHKDAYIEPAGVHGRFIQSLLQPFPDAFEHFRQALPQVPGPNFPMGAVMGPSAFPGMDPSFGIGRNSARDNAFGMGMAGMNFPGMPHIPDPMRDLLPEHVRQIIGGVFPGLPGETQRVDLSFPALRACPGWAELPESTQTMFEVEVAQLRNSWQLPIISAAGLGLSDVPLNAVAYCEYASTALKGHPKVSTRLKRFLLEGQ